MMRYFFDNASTTKVFDETAELMKKMMTEDFYNPSALYSHEIQNRIAKAREFLATKMGVRASELFFTSCATESNNWVFNCAVKNKNGNVVVGAGEHASVYEPVMRLKSKGVEVRMAPLLKDGRVDAEQLKSLCDENTTLVSVIACSNETGAINDLPSISETVRRKSPGALFHSDCVQAFLKTPSQFDAPDLMSFSAHKIGGPKGCGALVIKKGVHINSYMAGGGQEGNMRSGTENCAGIIGFASAAEMFDKVVDRALIKSMKDTVVGSLRTIENVIINDSENSSDFILSASIRGIKAEILQHLLYDKGFVIGLGSACSAKTGKNRILKAMGRSDKDIEGSIRISFGWENDLRQASELAEALKETVVYLRGKM